MDKVKVVNIDTAPATKSVKELRSELKLLKDQMLSTEQGTEEYNQALVQAAEIQHTLKEQMEQVNASAMDFGQIASNATKTVGGMVAGFQAAKATMNLFGVENENVLKSLEKMQNLMSLTQALPALDNGLKGFKALSMAISTATGATSKFGKALISTGLGALAVALGYIVANFDEISKWLDEITGQTDFLGNLSDKVIGGINAGWAGLVQTIKALGKTIVTYVSTPFKAIVNAINAFTSTQGGMGAKLKAAAKAMKDGVVSDWKEVGSEYKKIGEVAADAYQEGVNKNKAKRLAESEKERKERLAREKKAAEEEAKIVAEIKKRYSSLSEEIRLYNATELEKQLNEFKKSQDQALKTIEDAHKKRLISDEQYEKDKLAIEKHYTKLSEKAKSDAAKKSADEERKKSIDLIDTSYQLEQAKLKKQYDEKLISEKDFNSRKKELLTNYVQDYVDNIQYMLDTESGLTDEQILDLTNKINDARALLKPEEDSSEVTLAKQISNELLETADLISELSDNPAWGSILGHISDIALIFDDLNKNHIEKGSKEAYKAYTAVAGAAFSTIGDLMNGLAAEQDTTNEEGFEKSKKMQIAGATMQMLSGIVTAISGAFTTKTGPWDIALAAIQAAMIGAMGAANIAKIAQTKFDGSASAASARPNTSAISSVTAPVQYTQDVQGASIEGAIKDTKVYVTETDITNTQKRVDVTESEAMY